METGESGQLILKLPISYSPVNLQLGAHFVGGPDTSRLAHMQCINIRELVLGQKPRWHTRPTGENDERETIGQNQSTSSCLEDLRMEDRVRVTHECNSGRNVDHGVCPEISGDSARYNSTHLLKKARTHG